MLEWLTSHPHSLVSNKSEEFTENENQSKLINGKARASICSIHKSVYPSCQWWSYQTSLSFLQLYSKVSGCMWITSVSRSSRQCGMGDRCAMKFGPRIGKLCDCGRGANCNSYLLKCIWSPEDFSFLFPQRQHHFCRTNILYSLGSNCDSHLIVSLSFISIMCCCCFGSCCLRISMGYLL